MLHSLAFNLALTVSLYVGTALFLRFILVATLVLALNWPRWKGQVAFYLCSACYWAVQAATLASLGGDGVARKLIFFNVMVFLVMLLLAFDEWWRNRRRRKRSQHMLSKIRERMGRLVVVPAEG